MADRIIVLNAGRIEQIGTPSEIYHNPASTFVASFMGAPPMNLIRAQVADAQLRLSDHDGLMPVPHAYAGPVTMGIRPEDVVLDGQGSIPFRVDILEELGAHRLLHGAIDDQPFTVMVGKEDAVQTGETRVTLRPETLRLFDAETGQTL